MNQPQINGLITNPPYVPDAEAVANYAACIAFDLRETLDAIALDLALATEAPEGESVDMAIENALLAQLAKLLNRPGLQISDLTPERIKESLGATLILDELA